MSNPNKINPIELMLELYGYMKENYSGLSAEEIKNPWSKEAGITLRSRFANQKIKIKVEVEDLPEPVVEPDEAENE